MGRPDSTTKAYMRDNAVFADAFNYFIYGGRQVVEQGFQLSYTNFNELSNEPKKKMEFPLGSFMLRSFDSIITI